MTKTKVNKSDLSNIGIIGSGPTALYLLKYLTTHIEVFKNIISKITIFEKEEDLGMGMPYNPQTTDRYNLANISSEEIPALQESFADWLRKQDKDFLLQLNINDSSIDDGNVYSRISLGYYFAEQFQLLIEVLESHGIIVKTYIKCEVIDISQELGKQPFLTDSANNQHSFSTIVIANGHEWNDEDRPEAGYYASPWPINKIIKNNKAIYNFPVGTLGASLSAFDVVSSLAHRHGKFLRIDHQLTYQKNPDTPNFKLVMHSAEGWLPHLQYEQKEPIREIYRHFTRNQLLTLVDDDGFMRIENYFNVLCRPALIKAFAKDRMDKVVEQLNDHSFTFKDLVDLMSEKHNYVNSFEGMKFEMIKAENSVEKNIPINWMETLDDLMYSLNYHAELLPATDHLFFHKEIISFLMNVIAALPLQSAEILLALYDADCIDVKSGLVEFPADAFDNNTTKISVKSEEGSVEELEYQLFVNCSGDKKLELQDYPFQSLVKQGIVRTATAKCKNKNSEKLLKTVDKNSLVQTVDGIEMKLSGIQIDSSYRTIRKNGEVNNFLYDINFNHTKGLRPYSYGLQACSATSLILVESWKAELLQGKIVSDKIETITELYDKNL